MQSNRSPLIEPSELKQKTSIVIVDARSGADAYARFLNGHLENALFVDLDRDLSQKPEDPTLGGRHPLPKIKTFAALIGKLGISPSTDVVVYDDKAGANAAARFWWMMRAIGHETIQVINGGLDALTKAGAKIVIAESKPISTNPYPVSEWKLPTVDIDAVKNATRDSNTLIIDVREGYRYRGESEPIDLIAGHIPAAVNVPYVENLKEDGSFRGSGELKEKYQTLLGYRKAKDVIVHCGSGVTACHTLLALEHAGMEIPNLYVGSWSEWSRRGLPIAKED